MKDILTQFKDEVYSVFAYPIDNNHLKYITDINSYILDNQFFHIEIRLSSPEINGFENEVSILCEFKKQTPNSWKAEKIYSKKSKKLSETIRLCEALKEKFNDLHNCCDELL